MDKMITKILDIDVAVISALVSARKIESDTIFFDFSDIVVVYITMLAQCWADVVVT